MNADTNKFKPQRRPRNRLLRVRTSLERDPHWQSLQELDGHAKVLNPKI
jgi:hypothetical protein